MSADPARRVFFDVDDTILTFEKRLRRHTHEVFAEIVDMGFEIYVWSGVGRRWEVVAVHGLGEFVRDCYIKPLSRHHERLVELGIPFVPDHVVDDEPEIVRAFGGTHVPAPLEATGQDDALLQVVHDLRLWRGAP